VAVRRVVLGVLGWLAVAASAVTIGLLTVSLIGRGITSGSTQPLSSDAVARALDQAGATRTPSPGPTRGTGGATPTTPAGDPTPDRTDGTREPSPTGTPSSEVSAKVGSLWSEGGTVIARCQGRTAYLTSWSPHQGYETDEAERGPDRKTSVQFESASREVKVIVTCVGGRPHAEIETDDDSDDDGGHSGKG
jgi:hypothetical protein